LLEALMARTAGKALLDHFSALKDPRQAAKVLYYPLPEVMLLLLSATLAGADDFVEIQLWGTRNLAFLRRFLPYRHGIPSHDTLGAVVRALDPELFKACFTSWVEGLCEAEPDLIAIDGKTSHRTHAGRRGREPLHLVSAWAGRQRLVLGQEAVGTRSNEIVAIPRLLERLALTGALVTIDAIGCQTTIAEAIEPHRVCRRPRLWEGWGHDDERDDEAISGGAARARSAAGQGARGRAHVAGGSDSPGGGEGRLQRGDAAAVGSPG
jgi:hypothetical protein